VTELPRVIATQCGESAGAMDQSAGATLVAQRKLNEKRATMSLRLQTAYRARLGRRVLWRRRKLYIHAKETRAAIQIQCAVRVYIAKRKVARQRALVQYLKFVQVLKPGMKNMTQQDMEAYAAIKMQGAWRRRQAYFQAKRMKGARAYYNMLEKKYQGEKHITFDEVETLAASKMQAIWKGKKARRVTDKMKDERDVEKKYKAAVMMQKIARGKMTRKALQKEANDKKMKRLAGFFRNGCFFKCWQIWLKHTDTQLHFKEVAGRTLGRWMNGGMVRGFNALKSYAEAKADKRLKVHNAAIMAVKHDLDPRDRIWAHWADFMDDQRELWAKVGEKCSSFLHLITGDFVRTAFQAWKEMMLKDRKAKRRRTHYRAFTAWKAWQQWLGTKRALREIEDKIRSKWAAQFARMQLEELKWCVDDLLYNRSLVGDAVKCWLNKTVIHAFRTIDDFAQTQIHYRRTVANFRRRYELRSAMPIIRSWHEISAERAHNKRQLKKAIFTLYRRRVQECWSTWTSLIHDRKLAEREMAAKGSKTLMRIVKRPMVNAFEAWKKLYEEERRNREIFARISYRWQNAEVVMSFTNWVIFVDIAIEERREALRAAVLEAMQCGDLATLLRTAKAQQRSYHRVNLEEVMREVLEEEQGHLAQLAAVQPRYAPAGLPAGASGRAGARPGKKARREVALAREESVSPLRARPLRGSGVDAELSAELGSPRGSVRRRTRGGGGDAVPMPDFIDEGPPLHAAPELAERRRVKQVLPPYLRGSAPGRTMPAGGHSSRGVRFQTGGQSPIAADWPEEARRGGGGGAAAALAATMPAGDDPIRELDLGDATAYPLLGFDAELPSRDADGVKAALSQFESAARRDARGAKRQGVFPPIKKGRAAWPSIDDADDAALGLAGRIDDAREDLSLPPVVAAPIAMPTMMDD